MSDTAELWYTRGMRRKWVSWTLAVALLAIVAYYGLHALGIDSRSPVRLVVYAFSTQEQALSQAIFPAFEQDWESKTGRELTIEGVFGASGTLAGQINLGAPADVALLSNVEHVDWLRLGRRVRKDTQPVIVGCTPMAIVTRSGNPLQIAGYADLAQSGLNLLHADPRSSGAGEWGVLAEYGSALFPSNAPQDAGLQLRAIWRNVRLLAPSARAAMNLFELGAGDALVTYEQDALLAQERGVELEVVLPPRTILAQHAAVIVDGNVTRGERPAAEAFVEYLRTAGQEILGQYHMRSPECQSDRLPILMEPFTVDDLGGWKQAGGDVLEGLWQTEIEPGLRLDSAPQPETGEP